MCPHQVMAGTAALILLAGCAGIPVDRYNSVQQQLVECQESNRKIETQLADQQASISSLQEQVAALRKSGAPFDDLVVPVKIELDRLSGGYDKDGKAGDEGIVLYIRPMDSDGSVLKVAGTIRVTLFDLQNPPERHTLGVYDFDAQQTRSLWFGRLMTNHFTVRCPFPRVPEHDRITAEVAFTDLLTGRLLRAQEAYTIKRPPTGQPTAQR